MDQVVELYKEEISTYRQQIEDLKQCIREGDKKNASLINKVQHLEDLVEKANVANRDLNVAFEHLHQENMRMQTNQAALEAAPERRQLTIATRNEQPVSDTIDQQSLIWIAERDQCGQRIKFLERECDRYHRDNMHLSKQVRHLLKTLEEERGMIIRQPSSNNQSIEEDKIITCAADVIDKHLINFGSIEELQQQNQKLLTLIKNLSDEQEQREIEVENDEVRRLQSDLTELKNQLDTVKGERERVLNDLNTIYRERDLFKILLCKTREVEHMTPEIFQKMVAVACSTGPAITDVPSIERDTHIKDLKDMISSLEQKLVELKSEHESSQASLADELKLKNELLEKAHLRISEVVKSLEASNERNQLLESNIGALTAEFDETRTKCQKMTLELEEATSKSKQAENLNKELASSLETERQRYQDALIEVSQLKEQNQQLLESIERERQCRQQELTSIFKEIQDKQMRELEERAMRQVELQMKLSQSEQAVENLKTKMAQVIHDKDAAMVERINELEARAINTKAAEISELQLKLVNAERELDSLRAQSLSNNSTNDDVVKLKLRLSQTERELENVKSQLARVMQEKEAELATKINEVESKLSSAKAAEIKEVEAKASSARASEINELRVKLSNTERELQNLKCEMVKNGSNDRVVGDHEPKQSNLVRVEVFDPKVDEMYRDKLQRMQAQRNIERRRRLKLEKRARKSENNRVDKKQLSPAKESPTSPKVEQPKAPEKQFTLKRRKFD